MNSARKTVSVYTILLFSLILPVINWPAYTQVDGKKAFQLYCSRCHGKEEIRSGDIVFYSQKTIRERYRNKSRILLRRLENIDRYIKNYAMIRAVHKIQDRNTLIKIVNHLSDPDIKLPGDRGKDKGL